MRTHCRLRLIAWLAGMLSCAAAAQTPPAAGDHLEFGMTGNFLDSVRGGFAQDPVDFSQRATLDDLRAALKTSSPAPFGIAFNCAAAPSGKLSDCQPVYVFPEQKDGDALVRAIAPSVRLSPAAASLAAAKRYRVTINAGLSTVTASGYVKECFPTSCVANDPPPAPPPPPKANDPLVRQAIAQANDCFERRFSQSSDLRFKADRAVHDNQIDPPPPAVRAAVLDYVQSRTELKRCMAILSDLPGRVHVTAEDQKAIDAARNYMDLNFAGQTRYELAILIGTLDKRAGEEELSFPYP